MAELQLYNLDFLTCNTPILKRSFFSQSMSYISKNPNCTFVTLPRLFFIQLSIPFCMAGLGTSETLFRIAEMRLDEPGYHYTTAFKPFSFFQLFQIWYSTTTHPKCLNWNRNIVWRVWSQYFDADINVSIMLKRVE